MNIPREVDYAYLAGIVDGEGTITIHKYRELNIAARPLRYRVFIKAGNCHKGLAQRLQQVFGGNVCEDRSRSRWGWRPFYNWYVHAANGIPILRRILPYLVVKKEHAEIVIDFGAHFRCRGQYGRTVRIPESEMIRREILWRRIHDLNARYKGITRAVSAQREAV